jgi:flagellar basal-body rod modification protein FlgD
MTQVFPVSGPTTTETAAPTSNITADKDMFLRLLVAQLKYQDPFSPADSTQFLTQTAQFTTLETLQRIEKEQKTLAQASQTLSAASMVGRSVSYSLSASGESGPAATSVVSLRGALPEDAAEGARVTTQATVFTNTGAPVDIELAFRKTAQGWTVQARSNGHPVGEPAPLEFDGSGAHTGGDVTIPVTALDGIAGTSGGWAASGIRLTFGDSNDPTRLQLGAGPSTVVVTEQNGNDGNTATGIVTGIHMTSDGPMLVIGGREIPLASITDVQA